MKKIINKIILKLIFLLADKKNMTLLYVEKDHAKIYFEKPITTTGVIFINCHFVSKK